MSLDVNENGKFRVRQSCGPLFDIRFRREHVWFDKEDGVFVPFVDSDNSSETYAFDSIRTHVTMSQINEEKSGKDRYMTVAITSVTRCTKDKAERRFETYKRAITKMIKRHPAVFADKDFRRMIWTKFHQLFNTGVTIAPFIPVIA